MATLSKRDLRALFCLLALVLLFDGIGSGLVVQGIVFSLIVAGMVWYNGTPAGMRVHNKGMNRNVELIERIAIGLMLLGILIYNFLFVGLSIIIGAIALFAPFEHLEVDLWSVSIHASGGIEKMPAKTKSKR